MRESETAFFLSLSLSLSLSLALSLSLTHTHTLSFSHTHTQVGGGRGGIFSSLSFIVKAAHPAWWLNTAGWVIAIRFSHQRAPVNRGMLYYIPCRRALCIAYHDFNFVARVSLPASTVQVQYIWGLVGYVALAINHHDVITHIDSLCYRGLPLSPGKTYVSGDLRIPQKEKKQVQAGFEPHSLLGSRVFITLNQPAISYAGDDTRCLTTELKFYCFSINWNRYTIDVQTPDRNKVSDLRGNIGANRYALTPSFRESWTPGKKKGKNENVQPAGPFESPVFKHFFESVKS